MVWKLEDGPSARPWLTKGLGIDSGASKLDALERCFVMSRAIVGGSSSEETRVGDAGTSETRRGREVENNLLREAMLEVWQAM